MVAVVMNESLLSLFVAVDVDGILPYLRTSFFSMLMSIDLRLVWFNIGASSITITPGDRVDVCIK